MRFVSSRDQTRKVFRREHIVITFVYDANVMTGKTTEDQKLAAPISQPLRAGQVVTVRVLHSRGLKERRKQEAGPPVHNRSAGFRTLPVSPWFLSLLARWDQNRSFRSPVGSPFHKCPNPRC
jgi:hypothetical protein